MLVLPVCCFALPGPLRAQLREPFHPSEKHGASSKVGVDVGEVHWSAPNRISSDLSVCLFARLCVMHTISYNHVMYILMLKHRLMMNTSNNLRHSMFF